MVKLDLQSVVYREGKHYVAECGDATPVDSPEVRTLTLKRAA